jgi:hypothetical protein
MDMSGRLSSFFNLGDPPGALLQTAGSPDFCAFAVA